MTAFLKRYWLFLLIGLIGFALTQYWPHYDIVVFGYHLNLYSGLPFLLGAVESTTNPAGVVDRIQTLYNKKLLRKIEPKLKLAQYGQDRGYKTIGTTIRFYRPRRANLSGINAETVTLSIVPLVTPTAITEGTKPTNLTQVKVGYVDIGLGQRMGRSEITDKMQAIDLLNTSELYTDGLSGDCALDYDTVCRNALVNGVFNSDAKYSNATLGSQDGGYFERFAGVDSSGNSAADFATLVGVTPQNGRITRGYALGAITQMKTAKLPKIGGNYVGVAPPQVLHDIRQDEVWLRMATFKADPLIRDLELVLDGVAYVEANNPWVEDNVYGTEDVTDSGGGLIYTTLYLAEESFGIPTLNNTRAGGSQQAPKITILNAADKSDPHNQLTIFAWKSMFGCGPFIAAGYNTSATANAIGDVPRYVSLRTKSTFKQ